MKTPKKTAKEKQLGFGSNLMKKINIKYLNTLLIRFSLDGMNKDCHISTATHM
jgi:hypothetical protein